MWEGDLGEWAWQSHHIIMEKSGSPLGILSVINECNNRFKWKFKDSFLELKKKKNLQGKQTVNLMAVARRMKKISPHGGEPHGREGNFRKKKSGVQKKCFSN